MTVTPQNNPADNVLSSTTNSQRVRNRVALLSQALTDWANFSAMFSTTIPNSWDWATVVRFREFWLEDPRRTIEEFRANFD